MEVISTVNTYKQNITNNAKIKNQLRIDFNFLTKKYEEVQNLREYGMDSLWAEVGGYIGIFLGYSLLQVVDMLLTFLKWMLKSFPRKKHHPLKKT